MRKVVIPAINGHALGGGCELAMACDYRLMKKGKALIGLPEATLGILPGAGGTQRLPRLGGLSKAMDILLRGKAMGPEGALGTRLGTHDAKEGLVAFAEKRKPVFLSR